MASPPSYSLIHQVEDRLVSELGRVLRERVPQLCEQLEAMGERQARPADRQALFSASAMLRVRLASAGTMPELMSARKARSTRASLIEDAERRAIVLLDEDDLETQILAQDLAGAIISEAGTDYPAYLHMLGSIAPAAWREEEINPLAAKSIAAILLEAMRTPSDSALVRSALRSHTVKLLAPDVAQVIHRLNEQMIAGGVAPPASLRIERAASAAPAATSTIERASREEGAASPAAGPNLSGPSALDVSREVYSADWLGRSAFAKTSEGPRLAMAPVLQPVVEVERDAVAFAHSLGFMPYSRQARTAYFQRNRQRLEQSDATSGQLATLDIVSAMFDYVVDEARLPEPVKPLFWRLQQPALALALLDPAYLSEEKRSLRHLIENFGAIATAFSGEITRGSELHRRLETVVRAVEIVTSSLQSRSAVMAQQVEKEYQKASRSFSQLVDKVARERSSLESTPQRRNRRDYAARPSKERERAVTDNITRSLEERFARYEVPQSVKDFLTTVWVRQLRTAALRDGEDSAEYKVAMQVVDDLLWSLNGDRRQHSRKELAQRIPPLIRLLTDGVKRVGAKEEEQKAFFDELFLVHLRKMSRHGKGGQAIDASLVRFPQELVDQMTGGSRGPRAQASAGRDDAGPGLVTVPRLDEALDTRPPANPGQAVVGQQPSPAPDRGALGDSLPPVAIPSFAPAAPAASNRLRVVHPAQGEEGGAPVVPAAAVKATAPVAAGAAPAASGATAADKVLTEDDSARLFEVMNAVDLSDCPPEQAVLELAPQSALDLIDKGSWLRIASRDGEMSLYKVAWVNGARSLTLLVRFPDRRALSLRFDDLLRRLQEGQARLMQVSEL